MKKGGNVSKPATTSSSECSMKTRRTVNSPCIQKSRRVTSTSLTCKRAKSLYDLDTWRGDTLPTSDVQDLSPRRMHESLIRMRKNAVQPFTFLNNILDDETSNDCVPVPKSGPTEIDLQLAALTRRVRLNKSLLERTNERVKEINFLVERNAMTASRELNYGKGGSTLAEVSGDDVADNETALNVACPGISSRCLKSILENVQMVGSYIRSLNSQKMKFLSKKLAPKRCKLQRHLHFKMQTPNDRRVVEIASSTLQNKISDRNTVPSELPYASIKKICGNNKRVELKRTINVTKDMLTYVKKICNSEIEMKDLPEELSQHMSAE